MTVKTAIRQMTNRIARQFKPDKIVLFGSHARGAAGPDSDVESAGHHAGHQALGGIIDLDGVLPLSRFVLRLIDCVLFTLCHFSLTVLLNKIEV